MSPLVLESCTHRCGPLLSNRCHPMGCCTSSFSDPLLSLSLSSFSSLLQISFLSFLLSALCNTFDLHRFTRKVLLPYQLLRFYSILRLSQSFKSFFSKSHSLTLFLFFPGSSECSLRSHCFFSPASSYSRFLDYMIFPLSLCSFLSCYTYIICQQCQPALYGEYAIHICQ